VKRYRVRLTRTAQSDLIRLFRFFEDNDSASQRHLAQVLTLAFRSLGRLPFASRMAGEQTDPTLRELVIPFGSRGYVLLFRVSDRNTVSILAARHQREEDYH